MKVTEVKMNLFAVDKQKYVFAHCVSACCAMGQGIAKEFRHRYPYMPYFCLQQNPQIGKAIRFIDDAVIYNLVTKDKYWQKPTYLTVKKSLIKLRDDMIYTNEKYLAIPRIGCGLDKLDWIHVKSIIEEIFTDTDIEILVCVL